MKILQVNAVFRRGSTGKIVGDIHDMLLENQHESVVCYGRKTVGSEEYIYKTSTEWEAKLHGVLERVTGYSYKFSFFGTKKLIKTIKAQKPDVVHLHILNGYYVNVYALLNFLKEYNVPTVLTLHAELMHTGGCGHSYDCEKWKIGCGKCPQLKDATHSLFFDRTAEQWQLMKHAFAGFINLEVVAVSGWLGKRANISPVLGGREINVIGNGIDTTNIFYPRDYNSLKTKLKLDGSKIILHVSPAFSSKSKGGNYILELAERLKNHRIMFIVVGFDGDQNELPSNIIGIRHTKDQQELAVFYSMADITLLTSKRETFSMVCAESLSCGTPVVGFHAGAPEEISLKSYSEFVKYGSVDALEDVVHRWLNKDHRELEGCVALAQQEYSRELMFNRYMTIYTKLARI